MRVVVIILFLAFVMGMFFPSLFIFLISKLYYSIVSKVDVLKSIKIKMARKEMQLKPKGILAKTFNYKAFN